MKNSKILSFMLMAMVLVMPTCVSCSSDDEGASTYTSEEITELLMGKWTISGDLNCETTSLSFDEHYKGTIEFKNNNKYVFNVTESDLYKGLGKIVEYSFANSSSSYSVLKKGGDSYLILGNSKCPFKIVSLKKNSLKLVLDEDVIDLYILNSKQSGHVYMTILSN